MTRPNPQVAVVLGAGLDAEGELTRLSRNRLDAGAELWRRGIAKSLVVMGGRGQGWSLRTPLTERPQVEQRREYLESCGVNANDIICAYGETRDTIGEAFVVRRCINGRYCEVYLITSDTHMPRALFTFDRIFGQAVHFQPVKLANEECGLNAAEEEAYMAIVRAELLQLPSPVPDPGTWEDWYRQHPALYEEFSKLRSRFAAIEDRPNEAYAAWYQGNK